MHYTLENRKDYFCLYSSVYYRLHHCAVDIITETILKVTNLKSKNSNYKKNLSLLKDIFEKPALDLFCQGLKINRTFRPRILTIVLRSC